MQKSKAIKTVCLMQESNKHTDKCAHVNRTHTYIQNHQASIGDLTWMKVDCAESGFIFRTIKHQQKLIYYIHILDFTYPIDTI